MPVNLPEIGSMELHPVEGVKLGWAEGHIKKPNRKDVLVVEICEGASVGGVFTLNRFCAAPVTLCRKHLAGAGQIRALVVNTGSANAGTGEQGMQDAIETCKTVGELLNVSAESVLPFSTGVILENLPMDRLLAALPNAVANLSENQWHDAAYSIMTTDVAPKGVSEKLNINGKPVVVTGISKGAGMILPNMATMLGYLATDAGIEQQLLNEMTKEIADLSFNCISVDGDTSTNDSFIIIASGKSDVKFTSKEQDGFAELYQALLSSAQKLAQAIVRDGEGATKFMSVHIHGAKTMAEAKAVGFAIGKSPLVKTAFFASDPNLGRILAAIGYAARECDSLADLDTNLIDLYLGDVLVADQGGLAQSYQEEDGQDIMDQAEIDMTVKLNRGEVDVTIWTCDFSYEYVRINADYRS